MKSLGIVDAKWPVPPRDKQVPAWASLDDAKKKEMAHKMGVYAAQIDRLDQGVGRIVDALTKTKRLDDTLILFMADNGGCEEGGIWGFERKKGGVVGEDNSFASYGRGWAWLSNCIFRLFKHWVHGGGVRTPMIAHWPNGIADQNQLRRQPAHLIDVIATCVELAGAKYPTEYQGQKITPLEGKSLVPAFANKPIERDAIYWEHEGNRAILVKNWKLVAVGAKGPWELYDLDKDGAETNDLAKQRPTMVKDLAAKWQAWAVRAHVVDQPIGKNAGLDKKDADQKQADPKTPYADWQHSGSVYVLPTPEGANLSASASENNFPLLVRLHKDFFNFNQAMANGEDLRVATSAGMPLDYQIDEWDAANGTASIWVRIPNIKGNARQEIKLYWGKADAASESNGKAVFNESNGYLSVWHMTDPARDDVGTLASINQGTTAIRGIIGQARHFDIGKGIRCGDNITNYPSGSDSHTSEAWVRADKPNGRVLAWGIEKGQGKVVMQVASPPHIQMECYFSGANVSGSSKVTMSEWVHVVHTYKKGESRVYVNGKLDGVTTTPNAPLSIPTPAKMWLGGWYNTFNFVGDLDEVRISKVVRSADWIKLQYENQKPLQTLVGPVVQSGDRFSVSQSALTVLEGKQATVTAEAGGAQKIYWILKRDGQEAVVAVDRLTFTLDAGRVVGNQSLTLQLKAIYANEVKTKDIAITIKENIPEPIFTLKAPARWDGRETIEIMPQIVNAKQMQAQGAGKLNYRWTVSDIATITEIVPGKLILKRAQNSGKVTVTVSIDNGGQPSVKSITINVEEPKREAWVQRIPAKDEKPVDNQFYARDDKNEGTLHYNGTLKDDADSVFLKVTANDLPYKTESKKLSADKSFTFSVKLKPGLIKYKVEFGTTTGGRQAVLHTVTNLVCGDAYLIQGQSNAEATDVGKEDPPYTSDWIRSYGSMSGSPDGARLRLWGPAVCRDRKGGKAQIGYWGLELAKRLVEEHKIPVCIINGAVGGSRIDQHQRNSNNPEDVTTIYGRTLWRVQQAKLTHGIRGVLWHQGENDQGADGPTGRYGWETYKQYFVDLSAAWKQDFPNIQHYYMFQIWPRACSMGINGSDNHLREVQRKLPTQFSNLHIMSTLGIKPPGGCHFPPAGYAEFARLICPLIERENYGKVFKAAITPPDVKMAYYTSDKKDELVLEFDQPIVWTNSVANHFYLDGSKGKIASGVASGKVVTLKLTNRATARNITYLDSRSWSQDQLLLGENGIAALTFCEVPILSQRPFSP